MVKKNSEDQILVLEGLMFQRGNEFEKKQDENILPNYYQSHPQVHQLFEVSIKNFNLTLDYLNQVNQDTIYNYLLHMTNFSYQSEIQLGEDVFVQLLTGKSIYWKVALRLPKHICNKTIGQYYRNNKNSTIYSEFCEFAESDLCDLEQIGIKDSA